MNQTSKQPEEIQNLTHPPLPPALEEFLDTLIADKKFPPSISDAFIEQIKSDLRPTLTHAINLNFYSALSDVDRLTFDRMALQDKSPEEMQQFLEEKVENQEYLMASTLVRFRNKYLGLS